jgi:hypothetical protein
MQDLLEMSPNAAYASMLGTWSAVTMRQLSFRRLRAEEWLSTPTSIDKVMKLKAENVQNVDFLLTTQHDIYDSRLLPGIPFSICVSSHGSLHLVSTATGEEVASWQCTAQSSVAPLQDVILEIDQSRSHGIVILACSIPE